MSDTIQKPTDHHLSPDILLGIYEGAVTQQNDPAMYAHLSQDCVHCETTLAGHHGEASDWDLAPAQNEAIYSGVERAVFTAEKETDSTVPTTILPAWLHAGLNWKWGWMSLALVLVVLGVPTTKWLITPGNNKHVLAPLPSSQQPHGLKNGLHFAHFLIKVVSAKDRLEKKHRFRRFVPGGRYPTGTGFLIGFVLTRPGYISILRENNKGQLETLYPFAKEQSRSYAVGRYEVLRKNAQPMIYTLDARLPGRQKLILVYSQHPLSFPSTRRELTQQQKKTIRSSDTADFIVQ